MLGEGGGREIKLGTIMVMTIGDDHEKVHTGVPGYKIHKHFGVVHNKKYYAATLNSYAVKEPWILFHLPSRIGVGRSFKTLKEAKVFGLRIAEIKAVNWSSAMAGKNMSIEGRDLDKVGNGEMTAEDLDVQLMTAKIKGEI